MNLLQFTIFATFLLIAHLLAYAFIKYDEGRMEAETRKRESQYDLRREEIEHKKSRLLKTS